MNVSLHPLIRTREVVQRDRARFEHTRYFGEHFFPVEDMLEQLLGKDEIEIGVRKRKLIMREPDSMKPLDVAALRLVTLFPVQSEIRVPQLKNIDSISVIAKVEQRADVVAQTTTYIQDPASCRETMAN